MRSLGFGEWLREQLKQNGMSQAELSHLSGVSEAQISRVISGSNAGEKFCRSVAKGLKLPPETVFRAAGLLDALPKDEADFEEWRHLLAQLPEEEREELYQIARLKIDRQNRRGQEPGLAGS